MKTVVRKVVGWLEKVPIIIAAISFVITNIIFGLLITREKLVFSEISHLFSIQSLVTLCGIELSTIFIQYLSDIFSKILNIKILNNRYRYYQERVYNSCMSDIQKASTGKIFDAVSVLSKNIAHLAVMLLSITTYAIPFITIVYKVGKVSIVSAILNIISITLATIIILMSDKIGKFSVHAAEFKSMLSGVSADNFMNVKTLKYMGRKEYANKKVGRSPAQTFPVVYKSYTTFIV